MGYKVVISVVAFLFVIVQAGRINRRNLQTKTRNVPQSRIVSLAQKTDFEKFYDETLKPLMRVRVPGTEGHAEVRKFIKKEFTDLKWSVTEDVFQANTPFGVKEFRNIIATLNPTAGTRHVMAAHYDSKFYNKSEEFLGATDSAVPCAMLIELAHTVTPLFRNKKLSNDVTLQMVFFDGEEAFKQWNNDDSIYGSKHLASFWGNKTDDFYPSDQMSLTPATLLDSVNSLILLDLLGAPKPKFYDMHPATTIMFQELVQAEKLLNAAGQLQEYSQRERYFQELNNVQIYIEDDHIPFLKKDVPILHIIPVPFPSCWHKFSDNYGCLHKPTIHNLIKIIRLFLVHRYSL